MDREPIGTGRRPQWRLLSSHLFKHRGRSPDPLKTYPDHGVGGGLAGGNSVSWVTEHKQW